MIIHFDTQEQRLAYLKGGYLEIIPEKAKPKKKTRKKKNEVQAK